MDTRPGWDDTGVTASSLFLLAAAAAFAGLPAWLAAALVAAPILFAELDTAGSAILLIAGIPLLAACVGATLRRAVAGPRS